MISLLNSKLDHGSKVLFEIISTQKYRQIFNVLALLSLLVDVVVAISPWNKDLREYTFLMVILFGGLVIVIYTIPLLRKLFNTPVYAKLLPVTRISYSLLCLITALQNVTLIPSGIEPENLVSLGVSSTSILSYSLVIAHIGGLILLIVGRYVQTAWIIVFVSGVFVIPFDLGIFVKNTISFYAIFLPPSLWKGRTDYQKYYEGWPLVLMGLSLAFLISGAGVFKLIDPVWLEGMGLYYSLNIPFFTPKHLWPLLDFKWLMVSMNWVTIITEIIALPCFIFRKTRPFAILGVILLGLFLTYPMWGIGIIGGPVILSIVPALIAISPETIKILDKAKNISIFKYFIRSKHSNYFIAPSCNIVSKSHSFLLLGIFVFWYSFLCMIDESVWKVLTKNKLPPKYGSFESKGENWYQLPEPIHRRLEMLHAFGYKLSPPRISKVVWLIPLFDYHHLFDRALYKVVLQDKDDKSYEPVEFFNEDGSVSVDYPLWANERFLLTCWEIMLLSQKKIGEGDKVPNRTSTEFNAVIRYCKSYLPDTVQAKTATILAKPIHQPYEYKGNYKPWKRAKWDSIYRFNFDSQKGQLIGMVERYKFHKLNIPAFRDSVIVP